jgi:inorganic phosphate transporter, PiT family
VGTVSFLLVVVILTALAFDFTNGFHDTANSMATSIATGALQPRVAVIIAGVLNLAGAFLSTEVAKTISGGIVDDAKVSLVMIFAGLVGAVLWNLMTWLAGLPSSSSHALFGGLIGAVWVGAGGSAVQFGAIVEKILIPAVLSPIVACVVAVLATYFAYIITRRTAPGQARSGFRRGQIGSASLVALAHGTNDAQKTMGVITLALISAGVLTHGSGPPWWVVLISGLAIALGTYTGGWRIIRTMGTRLAELQPIHGFVAETTAGVVIEIASRLGYPLSTTHVISSSILGVGASRRLRAVRWSIAGSIVTAWIVTIPTCSVLAWGIYRGVQMLLG